MSITRRLHYAVCMALFWVSIALITGASLGLFSGNF